MCNINSHQIKPESRASRTEQFVLQASAKNKIESRDKFTSNNHRNDQHFMTGIDHNVHTRPWSPKQTGTSVKDVQNSLQSMTVASQESFNLPKLQILTFSGNPTDYCKFIAILTVT